MKTKFPKWAKTLFGIGITIVAVATVVVITWAICSAVNQVSMLDQWHTWFPAPAA